jgi:transposase
LIERAYTIGESLGLSVWTEDEAGPFQTLPYEGHSWQPEGQPRQQPHEYVRNGTAKLLTLFHPADGQVRVKGVTSCTNAVLHPWLRQELRTILAHLPPASEHLEPETNRALWESWCAGLDNPPLLPPDLPPLRMLLVWDNLTGHKTPCLVDWLIQHGIMPLYTPLGGSWLNMSESIQRILKRRALAGQHPTEPAQIIAWLEAVAKAWNRNPTPFEWEGKRARRRARSRQRRHALGGSGACTRRPIRRLRPTKIQEWRSSCQMAH